MATRNEIFPSKYLKACDVGGKPAVIDIEVAMTETLGSGSDAKQKTVLYFRGKLKPLVLNMTNWDAVADIAGGDTDDWSGHTIEVYPTTTTLKGQTVDCVRVRRPRRAPKQTSSQQPLAAPAKPKPAEGNDDMDDDIPSEGGESLR
jgi:hypothetical protein